MSETSHKRAHRVAHLVQQELARLLVQELKDPRVGFVTVTEVRLTDDLHEATAYVSVMGEQAERHASMAGLEAAQGFLKRALGQRLGLRYVPALRFAMDDTLDRAQRLEVVLAAAAAGAPEAPPLAAQAPLPAAVTGREMPEVPPPAPKPRPAPARRTGRRRRLRARP